MTVDPLDRTTRLLRDAVTDAGDVDAMPPARDAAVARLAEAIRGRARQKRRSRALYMFSAAAALLLASGAIALATRSKPAPVLARAPSDLGRVTESDGGVTAMRDGRPEAVEAGARVAEGTELHTTALSEAHLDFDSGTHITLGGTTRVRLVEQSQRKRFALESGSLAAKVAKLGRDERFVVVTPDAEVEVRGTAFRVTIVPANPACAGGSPTRLEVSEGVVVIRHGGTEERVAAGERWPACDERHAAVGPNAGASAPPSARAAAGTGTSAPARAGKVEATSHLAEQNDLFDEAMRAKRAGHTAAALAKLDRLIDGYPGGPLAESAATERLRMLATSPERARAAAAARDYLRRHPRGLARAEAEAILGASP